MESAYDFVITIGSLEKKMKKDPGAALICLSSLKMDNFIKSLICSWIKKLTTSIQHWKNIFLAIDRHDQLKNTRFWGYVHYTDVLFH